MTRIDGVPMWRSKYQGHNPDAWKPGMPQYVVKTFADHQAPEHGWKYAVYDLRNAYQGDPVLAWCRTSGRAKKIVDAMNRALKEVSL